MEKSGMFASLHVWQKVNIEGRLMWFHKDLYVLTEAPLTAYQVWGEGKGISGKDIGEKRLGLVWFTLD